MISRIAFALVSLGCVLGCASMPISDKMARNMDIPTGKPVPDTYVGKAAPVEEVEGSSPQEGDSPEGVAYPRAFGKPGGRIEINLREFSSTSSDYEIYRNSTNLYFSIIPKDSNNPKFFAEIGFEIGYGTTEMDLPDFGGDQPRGSTFYSDLSLPIAFELNLVASQIEIEPAGFFEIETTIRMDFLMETYDGVTVWNWSTMELESSDILAINLHPRLAVVARRMAGKPTPLEFIEPFAGLIFNFYFLNLSDATRDESFTALWLDMTLGLRLRPADFVYGELQLIFGANESTIQGALGFNL
ncbi:MAG: hypothetical protein ACYTFG_12385 [Planctomycetota bacterium]|jgi:hypothetical protein